MPTKGEAMTTAYAWAPITKVEEQDDGTVMVYGPAIDAGVDRDRQRFSQDWLDKAMPAWMAEGGNVREQHQPTRAVGVAVGLTRGEDGAHNLVAHVVDPLAVKKVQTKVLKGFSVGVKDPQLSFGKADAPNGEIVGGSIVEVSLVDRPANPRTLFTMVKADAAGELEDVEEPEVEEDEEGFALAPLGDVSPETVDKAINAATREQMASSGVAMANGDFPIPDEGHLRSAVGHLGNYEGNTAAAKAHIITRARALGLVNLLPDEWGVTKADAVLAEVHILVPATMVKADAASDVADAMDAIACIGRLICSEATSMGGGQLDDADQIACLLDAVRALKYFISCERAEPAGDSNVAAEVADSMSVSGASYMADAVKTETTPAQIPAETPDLAKVDNPDMAAIVKAAVAEATASLRDELLLVKADVTKALAMPEPGGPVAMRTASQTAAARGADAASLRAQAAGLLAKAEERRREDPLLAMGYRERAADLLAKADA